jgi:hypothetical protein
VEKHMKTLRDDPELAKAYDDFLMLAKSRGYGIPEALV